MQNQLVVPEEDGRDGLHEQESENEGPENEQDFEEAILEDAEGEEDLEDSVEEEDHLEDSDNEDSDEDDPWHVPNPLPQVVMPLPDKMDQDDPCRMGLKLYEWSVAKMIRSRMDRSRDHNISDFMCAQIALTHHNELDPNWKEDAMNRADGVEAFRNEYLITDTVEEGCRAIQELVQMFPRFFLHFGFSEDLGTYLVSVDNAGFDKSPVDSHEKLRKFMQGWYYLSHALAPDMETIRKGTTTLVECEDVDWRMKKDWGVLLRLARELHSLYPNKSKVRHYHTGVFLNVMVSMVKKLLPEHHRVSMLETGCTMDGKLGDIFLVPTVEAANHRFATFAQQALRRRYENERSFSLQ